MWKLSDLIGDYVEQEPVRGHINTRDVPIPAPAKMDWNYQNDPRRLSKMFKFSDETKFNSFIMDLLEHQAETSHHGRITMQWPQIKIEVWTHSLNDVTEIDIEWAMAVNEIYEGYHG